ncbi:MAG: hypothetical protein AB7K71_37505 [Polyangiaceae bacterium]
MAGIDSIVHWQLPECARFVEIKVTNERGVIVRSGRGWTASQRQSNEGCSIVTPHLSQMNGRQGTFMENDEVRECTIHPISVTDEVERIEALRAQGTERETLGVRYDYLLYSAMPGNSTSYELIFGFWLYQNNEMELSRRILGPILQSETVTNLLRDLRMEVGEIYGWQMFDAFAAVDYKRAEQIGEVVVSKFPNSRFSHEARELLIQLPTRQGDYVELVLPTHEEWASLRKSMSRGAAISYLCTRLRLIRPSLTHECRAPDGSPRINPLVELQRLPLSAADVPQLSEFLNKSWYLPIRCTIDDPFAWHSWRPADTKTAIGDLIGRVAR